MILLGILIASLCAKKYIESKHLDKSKILNLITNASFVGILGGRALHVLSDLEGYTNILDIFRIWQGGLSILGTMISVTIYAIWYCYKNGLPLLEILDMAGIYAPLVHAIARIGCFCAGCCYGASCNLPWAITYTHPLSSAPLNQALHPSQIYSSLIYLVIFFIINRLSKNRYLYPGQLFLTYFIASAFERLTVDFFRNDRIFNSFTSLITNNYLSFHQILSIFIIILSIIFLIIVPTLENIILPKAKEPVN